MNTFETPAPPPHGLHIGDPVEYTTSYGVGGALYRIKGKVIRLTPFVEMSITGAECGGRPLRIDDDDATCLVPSAVFR